MSDAMITRRGGGVLLNFRITQYNEGTDMSRIIGKPNEIAVLTENKIDGWQFSYEEPENPTTGMVWIKLSNTSHAMFNVLKKNAIILGGAAAHQYLTGEWQPKHAQIYQDGSWHDFRQYLFREGLGEIVKWRGAAAVITDNSIQANSNGNGNCNIATFDMFDFSNYQKLFLDLTPTLNTNNGYLFGITFSRNSDLNSYYSATIGAVPAGAIQNQQYPVGTAPVVNGTRATIELEIADAVKESPCYLAFGHSGLNNPEFTIHNVWLE